MASQVDAVEREFLLCARYGELEEMLEELAKGADVMARGDGGNTALHMACANGHEAIVAALLDRGAEPSATNDCGNTPAHYAAQQRHAPCLRLIVAREGADVLRQNEFGRSALTDAIASGDGAVATIALEHDSATEEKRDAFDRARVVELGGGCGVGGLALAAACPTARVVVTDCFAETLENAAHNVALFREDRPDEQTLEPWFGSTARVASAKLDWDAEPGETCDFVVGADLVYHEAVVDKLVRTVVRLQAKEFWYAAPTSGRAGGDAFLARLETLGFEHVARDAPPAYGANALADGDDDKFLLYFPDVATATFALHRFVRPFK
ncbi:hypothetical protein AURANDRAFT_36302 [Aureococcus anophagefferens]|uniref:Uncharacterized protein n=1 Tax=Aureococcus anophagefferens TaxID=44056 RepID=F0Y0M5_AURAN|nr:hypothetical protein AURANDRAFT_36302 [Aureococcus anophagefferens]EGB11721.1 hypothetical protein AURANDRAFT_36302 [Aureococcus anophagefferens]|eukprot:XP_009034060.1 hypothetical protein AURANDRAFT_36302 [Aureococcus anophagefferens]